MSRALVFLLYGLAILTGVTGLFAGGVPLATYIMLRLRNPAVDYESYFDFISKALGIFMLSIILLIFVHVSYVIRSRFHPKPKTPVSFDKQQPDASMLVKSTSQPAGNPKERSAEETSDEKLARLISPKKE